MKIDSFTSPETNCQPVLSSDNVHTSSATLALPPHTISSVNKRLLFTENDRDSSSTMIIVNSSTASDSLECHKKDASQGNSNYVQVSNNSEEQCGQNYAGEPDTFLSKEVPETLKMCQSHDQKIAPNPYELEEKPHDYDSHYSAETVRVNDDSTRTSANHSQDNPNSAGYLRDPESPQDSHCPSCGHFLLRRGSSADSIYSPHPSLEVNPVQVSEKSPGEYHPLADSECSKKMVRRRRCKQCEKLRKEMDTLRKDLAEMQRTLTREREQSKEQVDDLKRQLYYERQENYELKQRVYSSEVRHRQAEVTIHQLQFDVQELKDIIRIKEDEKAGILQAYTSCSEMCKILRVRLQRADSMQCGSSVYYDNSVDDRYPDEQSVFYGDHLIQVQAHNIPGNVQSLYSNQHMPHTPHML